MKKKFLLTFSIVLFFVLFFYFDLNTYLKLENLMSQKQSIFDFYNNSPSLFVSGFFVFYVLCAAFSVPGAAILTLFAGFIFNFFLGCFIVSLGSTLGATLSFLMSRILLKDFVQKKFHSRLKTINKGFEKQGAFYLFSIRLIPIFPFFMVNLLMGLTPISVKNFFIASLLGMLPGTFVYVNAGSQISSIDSLKEIFSPLIILSFLLLAVLPWVMNFILKNLSLGEKLGQLNKKPDN